MQYGVDRLLTNIQRRNRYKNEHQRINKTARGRGLEFKSELPENADLAKTIVAFANVQVNNCISVSEINPVIRYDP